MCNNKYSYILICIILAGLLGGCVYTSTAPTARQPLYWPATDWPISTPEEQGLDSGSILSMLEEILNEELNIHSVLVIRNGYLVTEIYFPPYTQETIHPTYSITKSVTSAMSGIAIQDGFISSVQQNVLDLFPDIAEEARDENLENLTLEHLLTMSAGFNKGTLPDFFSRDASFDAVEHILTNNRVIDKPGETFYYDSGLPHVLSSIIQKTSGLTLEEYAQINLFNPLDITDYIWESDPQGVTNGSSGLGLRPQDMAKLGYLYLHNGLWDGEQVVPTEWVQDSTTMHMETRDLMNTAEDDGYGYYWWIDSFGGYSAHGYGGQYIFVLPGLDMIVVFTGGLSDSDFPAPHQLLKTYLLPAVQSEQPLEANPQIYDQLMTEIENIQNTENLAMPLPEIARQISGHTFHLVGFPPGGPNEFTLTFSGDETYTNSIPIRNGETVTVTGGLNNVFFLNELGPNGETIMAFKGYWRDEHTFVEEQNFDLSFDAQFFTVTYTFDGNKVSVTVDSSTGLFPTLTGTGEFIE
jgi:CubicO group peptidase (beta-lactamase class C family)